MSKEICCGNCDFADSGVCNNSKSPCYLAIISDDFKCDLFELGEYLGIKTITNK